MTGATKTSAALKLPTLICIGGARSASSWLNHSCQNHPDIGWLPGEPRSLSTVFEEKGVPGIADAYAHIAAFEVRGEKDPYYSTFSRDEVQRVHTILPNLRIIYLARNPPARSISHIALLRKRFARQWADRQYDSLWNILRLAESPIQTRLTDVARTLEIWSAIYPAEQILVINQDDIAADQEAVLRRIADFARIDPAGFRSEAAQSKTIKSAANNYPEHPFVKYYLTRRWSPMIKRLQASERLDVSGWIEKNRPVLEEAPLSYRLGYPLASLYFRTLDGGLRRLGSVIKRWLRLQRTRVRTT